MISKGFQKPIGINCCLLAAGLKAKYWTELKRCLHEKFSRIVEISQEWE